MKEEADALLRDLAESGCPGARGRMSSLLAAIQSPLDERLTRTVLEMLRSHRCFEAMQTFATEVAKVARGAFLIHVKRQLVQAKIEIGLLDEAASLLDGLVVEIGSSGARKERSEINGLLGRVHKQRFVQAVAGGATGERELGAAVRAHISVFDLDPAWHGANIVALMARAERDGFELESDSAERWARRLLDSLAEKARAEWSPWDFASAGEAYLALEDQDNVADCFAHYWNMSNADAFALAGTQRQLREIWQITNDSQDQFNASLLLHLEARKLIAAKGGARYSATDLKRLEAQLRNASGQAEATFGAGSAIALERILRLLSMAKSVCRVVDLDDSAKSGTGFLVSGGEFDASLDGIFVLTNHHVLHGDEADDALLSHPDYRASIHASRAVAEFHYWGGAPVIRKIRIGTVQRSSPRKAGEGDFALASLAEVLSPDLALPLSRAPKPLGSRNILDPKQRAKVIIVGHPSGGELSFSLSDNEIVDHELDDTPRSACRRIHYRTPTAPGSSGSPVFHDKTLEVVGVHRSGRATPLRSDWPRAKDDEIYEANEAVSLRSLLGI
jgi:hypothetical protein